METKYEEFIKNLNNNKSISERELEYTETQKVEEMASYNRLLNYLKSEDVVVISASRGDLEGSENKKNNSILRSELLKKGYGVTTLKGGYVQQSDDEHNVPVYEDSSFVVNLNNDSDFFDVLKTLGKKYIQDSILISNKTELDVYYFNLKTGKKRRVLV